MVKKRRRHAAAYKFRIALEAVEGGKTIGRSSNEYAIRVKAGFYHTPLSEPVASDDSMVHARGPTSLNRAFYGG